MHNRARMIVSSILTKNLGVSWLWGQEYFREMLIDLDEASNNGGWQWELRWAQIRNRFGFLIPIYKLRIMIG